MFNFWKIFSRYHPNKKLSSFLFIISIWPGLCLSQQGVIIFEAASNVKEVLPNSYFEVSFILKNANGIDFNAPNFKNFKIISGPNKSTSMQIIQGQVSREMGFAYTLKPLKEGTFQIGSASIQANGKTLKTNPITIDVIKGRKNLTLNEEKIEQAYVVIEPNKTEVYPGEQILIDFKLYTTVSLDGYDIMEEPEYKGFYAQELRRFNSITQREIIHGEEVTTKILRRLALFPQRSGKLTIPSARIQLALIEDNERSGFFFSRNIKPISCLTDPVEITVKDLPPNEPFYFTGAVGKYAFQTSLERNQITTDDAVPFSILITGDGDIKRVQNPILALSDSLEVYPPKIVEEKIIERQGQLIGHKIVEYLILPKYPGKYSIHTSFSFFNTEIKKYEPLTENPFILSVNQGIGQHTTETKHVKKIETSNDIRHIKSKNKLEKNNFSLYTKTFPFLASVGLPVVIFISLFMFQKIKNLYHVPDNDTKIKEANKIVLQRLKTAKIFLKNNSSKEFYNEISKALIGYICDKTGIPLSEFSKNTVEEKLRSINIALLLIDDFVGILKTCEMALFAGMDNSSDMKHTFNKAVKLIQEIENKTTEKMKK